MAKFKISTTYLFSMIALALSSMKRGPFRAAPFLLPGITFADIGSLYFKWRISKWALDYQGSHS